MGRERVERVGGDVFELERDHVAAFRETDQRLGIGVLGLGPSHGDLGGRRGARLKDVAPITEPCCGGGKHAT